MATVHYHYMNVGQRFNPWSAGYMPDSSDVYTRKRDAIEWAEQLFGDSICDRCFRAMSRDLRARGGDVIHYFDRDCEREGYDGARCWPGADYVSIGREPGGIREGDYGEWECAC